MKLDQPCWPLGMFLAAAKKRYLGRPHGGRAAASFSSVCACCYI